MKILNLFAGIGGIRLPWGSEHEITAVELKEDIAAIYSKRFSGDKVVIGDAYQYLLNHFHEYDMVSAGPPCPSHSKMARIHVGRRYKGWKMKVQYPDLRLYGLILFLQHHFRGDWIVENVRPFYEPLIKPSARVGRHLFWSNKPIQSKYFKRHPIMYKNGDLKYSIYIDKLCQVCQIERNILGEIRHSWGYTHDGLGQTLRNTIHPDIAIYIWQQLQKKSTLQLDNWVK